MSPPVARLLIKFFREHSPAAAEPTPLTPREDQVLALLAQGFTNKEIAEKLACSSRNIAAHCEHIYAKLHVHCRAQAAAHYYQRKSSPPGNPT
jgi:non-specific serine/threonine protein kinase